MCLAIPGKELRKCARRKACRWASWISGRIRKCCLEYIPNAVVGDYALVHVGFALSIIDAAEAARTYALLEAMGAVMAEFDGVEPEPSETKGGQR